MADRTIRARKGFSIADRAVRAPLSGPNGAPLPSPMGVRILHVDRGSPAGRAGLLPGDVIVKARGLRVRRPADMRLAFWQPDGRKLHAVIPLEIVRDGQLLATVLCAKAAVSDATQTRKPAHECRHGANAPGALPATVPGAAPAKGPAKAPRGHPARRTKRGGAVPEVRPAAGPPPREAA